MSEAEENTVEQDGALLSMTADIVAAYASHNQMGQSELTDLIGSVHGKLLGLSGGDQVVAGGDAASDVQLTPAVPIDASVGRDAITCLECGKGFKTLKRHISTEHEMSPDEYRARWQLSKDYPLVAPSYSERRSDTAKKIGLGRKPGGGRKKKK